MVKMTIAVRMIRKIAITITIAINCAVLLKRWNKVENSTFLIMYMYYS